MVDTVEIPQTVIGTRTRAQCAVVTVSYKKIRDWKKLLLRNLLQPIQCLTRGDKMVTDKEGLKKCGGQPTLTVDSQLCVGHQ